MIAIVRSCKIFVYMGAILTKVTPYRGFGIFRKDTSKYAKPMGEPYICYNLKQIYRFFSFLTKKNESNFETYYKIVWKIKDLFLSYIYDSILLVLKASLFFEIKLL